ncbi:hypothetical protein MNBD_GAMMA07-2094 [hydrothermal vent metagenome]|uniref:Uncharacterized protein n=1 Tax=hydrothermal vent metagenome TaxID=652676 RepID=A0A3B0WZY2_9ZZZZ
MPNQGSKGKEKKEKPLTANNTRTKETVITLEVYNCDTCGENLSGIVSTESER